MKYPVRFRFSKTGRAKYISHLDLVRCMQRALRRSGLPVHYSEGFHPHMETTFAAALPLGMESTGEILEVQFAEPIDLDVAKQRLQQVTPQGIQLLCAYKPVHKMKELAYVKYQISLFCIMPSTLLQQWQTFLQQSEVQIEKKTKRGMRTIDLLPQIHCLSTVITETALQLQLCLSVGTPESVNPLLILEAFSKFSKVSYEKSSICRLQLYTNEKTEFF